MGEAQNVVFAPPHTGLSADEDFRELVKRRFVGVPFTKRDVTIFSMLKNRIISVVSISRPHGPIKIYEMAKIGVRNDLSSAHLMAETRAS